MASILWHILKIFYISRWYHLIGITLIGTAIYVGILCILKEFRKEDFIFFIDTINVKKLIDYVSNEIKKR